MGRRRSSGIPRSTQSSRDSSPSRGGYVPPPKYNRYVGRGGSVDRPVGAAHHRPPVQPLETERMLRQSREAESALADALVSLCVELSVPFWDSQPFGKSLSFFHSG